MDTHTRQPVAAPLYHAQPPTAAPPPNPARSAGITLLVCALFLAIGLFTKGWATAGEGRSSISAGLFGFEACKGGRCESVDWDRAAKRLQIPDDVGAFRMIGMLSGLVGLGILIAAGVMALGRNTHKIPIKGFEWCLVIPAPTLTMFAFRIAAADRDVNFGPSYSPFLAIGALLVASVVLRKMLKPLVDYQRALVGRQRAMVDRGEPMMQRIQQMMYYAQPAMQQGYPAPQPACPRCGMAVQLTANQQRWCGRCQQYVA